MGKRPTGTVTFLFTDIEGSTQLWEKHPELMPRAFKRHEQIIRESVAKHGGYAYKMIGDAFQVAFATAPDALAAAIDAQRALSAENWGGGEASSSTRSNQSDDGIKPNVISKDQDFADASPLQMRVRMALHTGVTDERGDDYVGSVLNRAARLLAAAHGGQILLSDAAETLVRDSLPSNVTLRDLGEHRLKDLIRSEHIFQVIAADLPSEFPLPKTLNAFPNNLPMQMTSFIGRAHEIAEVKRLLSTARLVTLTGAGGCGKTRLALQVAAELLDDPSTGSGQVFADGAWLVELSPLADPGLVPQSIAAVLGVREEAGAKQTILAALTEFLRYKSLLLVLDNCEHLIDACAQLADALLHACPKLKILATSREALGIAGETPHRVPSLSVPDIRQPSPPENLTQYEAVRLFVDRAVTIQPTFTLTQQNASALAQICHRLDGIPLAIELAAARVKVLSVEQIAARLDDRFRLLTGGSRTALPRQQTLRSMVDWSYDLLSEPERVLLRRLSAFAGGWRLEAAESVCADDEGRKTDDGSPSIIRPASPVFRREDVLDTLIHLVDKSLVIVEDQDGESRYRMLETIRQYARDKLLESGEAQQIRARHADFFLKFAEQAEPKLLGADQLLSLNRLEAEHDNLRAALEWSLSSNDSQAALRLAGALYWFWLLRDYWIEGRAWLEQALARDAALSDGEASRAHKSVRAKALNAAMDMAAEQGDQKSWRAYFDESLALYRELGDTRGIANAEMSLGRMAWHQGDLAAARARLENALTLFRQAGDAWGIADSIHTMGHVASDMGEYAVARARLEESLAHFRQLGDTLRVSVLLSDLGLVAYLQRDYAAAERHFQESLGIFRQNKSREGIATSLNRLGDLARGRGDYHQAAALYGDSLTTFRELGEKVGVASILHNLAHIALHEASYPQARALFVEALEVNRELDNKAGISECLAGLAEVAALQGQPMDRAARLFGAADALGGTVATFLWPANRIEYDRAMAIVRAQLDEAKFNAAWTEGQAMILRLGSGQAMEQAIEYALEEIK